MKRTQDQILRSRKLRVEQTPSELLLWSLLRSRQLRAFKFRRQHAIGTWIVDFCCPRKWLVIELDGAVHRKTKVADTARDADLAKRGYRVLRFWNGRVKSRPAEVIGRILGVIEGKL